MIATILAEINQGPKTLAHLKTLLFEDEKSVMQAITFLNEEQKIKIYQDGRIGLK